MTTATKLPPVPIEQDAIRWIATPATILTPEERLLEVTIGLHLKSQAQWSNNWRATAGRRRQLRTKVMHALACVDIEHVVRHLQGSPTRVRFVRLAPRSLDTDNLALAFKAVRDQVCAWLACDNTLTARANDGARSGYEFSYAQQPQKLYAIKIEVSR